MKQESKNHLCRSMRILPAVVLIGVLSGAASAQNAVTLWNTIAARTVVQGKETPGMAGMFLAYADLAAFDALNAIHPRFQAYGGIQPAASAGASESAAVAAATHDVLVHYFPSQAASDPAATPPFVGLDERYADYLASLTDGAAAIKAGVQVGQQAAARPGCHWLPRPITRNIRQPICRLSLRVPKYAATTFVTAPVTHPCDRHLPDSSRAGGRNGNVNSELQQHG